MLYLLRFDFTLKHIPGTKIEKVDRLSRRLDWKVSMEKNNQNQVFIKDCQLCSLYEVVIEEPEVEIVKKIKKTRKKNKKVVRVIEKIKKIEIKILQEKKQQVKRNLVLKKNKLYMSKNKKLRIKIIQLHHNILVIIYKEK